MYGSSIMLFRILDDYPKTNILLHFGITAYKFGVPSSISLQPGIYWNTSLFLYSGVRIVQSLVFFVVVYRPLCVSLPFFF